MNYHRNHRQLPYHRQHHHDKDHHWHSVVKHYAQMIHRCLRNDRRLLQTLLAVSVFFCVNLFHLWRYYSPTATSNVWLRDLSLQKQQDHILTLPENNDYNLIFCNATNRIRYGGPQHPIFLWGIPSTNSDYEINRRQLLRKTYLSFFRLMEGRTTAFNNTIFNFTQDKDRICSLQEWTCQYEHLRDKCQIIYVFFIGGNPLAGPELLDETLTDFRDMLYDGHQVPKVMPKVNDINTSQAVPSPSMPLELGTVDKREPGVVYLNIRENQFDGKMTTWFQFAALVGQEFPEIDYAAKVDSDLLLFTPNFLEYMAERHTAKNYPIRQTYGGVEFPATNCVVNYTFDHACPLPLVGPSYMSGELNFLSMDLAKYIASDACPRKALTIPHEDVSLSNYVYSYETNVVYHETMTTKKRGQLSHSSASTNHTIDILSINNTRILLTPTLLGDWTQINLRLNPEILSHVLWGHSIRRGDYQRFLVFKKDKNFRMFWERFFRLYNNGWKMDSGGGAAASGFASNGNMLGSNALTPGRKKALRENLLHKMQERGQSQEGLMEGFLGRHRQQQQQLQQQV